MAAADAMVHSTAGLTVLEAHIRGCPVVSYGFSVGHLRANNAAFERFGLAEVASSEHELESMLRHVTRQRSSPDSSFASLPPIATRVLAARPRVRQQPVWKVRAERTATAVGLTAIVAAVVVAVTSTGKALPGDRQAAGEQDPLRQARRTAVGGSGERGGRRTPRPARPSSRRDSLIGALAGATVSAGAVLHAGPALAPVVPRWASARHELRQDGEEGVALTFDDGPHPQGTPAVLEILREARAPATFFLAGEQVARRPALAAEIVAAGHRVELHCYRHRNQLRLTPPVHRRRRTGKSRDRGGERPGDLRLPAAVRNLQRPRPAGDPAPRLAAGPLVAVGEGLDPAGHRGVDRAQSTTDRRRRHPASTRRRLLQRGRLLDPDRGGAAEHFRELASQGLRVASLRR